MQNSTPKKHNQENIRPVGYTGLAETIVLEAVHDFRKLCANGIIKDGKVTGYWPTYEAKREGRTSSIVNQQFDGIRCVADAQKVIDFLRGKWCKTLCCELYNVHVYKTMLEELGL